MTYMEHLQDNLRTYSPLVPLTDDDLEFLQQTADLMKQYPTIPVTTANTACLAPMVSTFPPY